MNHRHQHGPLSLHGEGLHHSPQWKHQPRHQHGPRWQSRMLTSTWLQAAAGIMDILMAFHGNMCHRYQHRPQLQQDQEPRNGPQWQDWPRLHHGLRQQPRPRTSVWPLVVTWATGINMVPSCYRTMDTKVASRGSLDHGGLLIQKINCSSSWTSCHWPESG